MPDTAARLPASAMDAPAFASGGQGGGAPGSGGWAGPIGSMPAIDTNAGDAAQAIADDLHSRYGLNDEQIAGVLGNLQHESGLKPDVNQGGVEGAPSGNLADDNANGWGLHSGAARVSREKSRTRTSKVSIREASRRILAT